MLSVRDAMSPGPLVQVLNGMNRECDVQSASSFLPPRRRPILMREPLVWLNGLSQVWPAV